MTDPLAITDVVTGVASYVYAYDLYGNQASIVDPMDIDLRYGSEDKETTFAYDELNRQISRTLPDGLTETFVYDGLGQQIRAIDFEGRVTDFVYDAFGRVETKSFAVDVQSADLSTYTRVVTYTYDAFGRMITADDDGHGVTNTVYDADGRVEQIVSPEGFLNYRYDRLGRQVQTFSSTDAMAMDAITDTQYTYDELGRLKTVEVHERNNTPLATPEITEYRYDKVGNLDQVETPGVVIADYDYDALNRLTLLRHFKDNDGDNAFMQGTDDELATFTYTVRADGKRESVIELDDSGGVTTIDWFYDELGRLTEEKYDAPGTADDFIARYGYDLASNRLRLEKDNDVSGAFDIDEAIDYLYDENDRLLLESLDSDGDSVIDQTTVYEYGVANDRTEQTRKTVWDGDDTDPLTGTKLSETTNTYNVRGRLETVAVDQDGDGNVDQTFTYEYNDSGIRVSSHDSVTDVTTLYHIDPQNHTGYAQVMEEGADDNDDGRLDADEIEKTYTLGHDVLAQQAPLIESGDTPYFLYDGHGSTRRLVDLMGQPLSSEIYRERENGTGLIFVPTGASFFPVILLEGPHPFPYRTRWLSRRGRLRVPKVRE